MHQHFWMLLFVMFSHVKGIPGNPVIQTEEGRVQGKRLTVLGAQLDAFYKIPFAEQPTGDLRFKKPVPARKWKEVLQSDTYDVKCSQFAGGDEDCLYLNVFSPVVGNRTSFPVIVWIHGGGYTNGWSMKHSEDLVWISRSQAVYVTFNYRLGAFGFLNCNHTDAVGNMGLFDQVLALEWVRRNIGNFGGNASDVTLIGYSAGAASVHYLASYPLARGLFHRKVMLSGSANAPWAFMDRPQAQKRCSSLLEGLRCPTDDVEMGLQCLMSKSKDEIVEATKGIQIEPLNFFFVPSIDKDFLHVAPGSRKFLESVPEMPTVAVTNRDEGSIFIPIFFIEEIVGHDGLDPESFNPIMSSLVGTSGSHALPELLKQYIGTKNTKISLDATQVVSDFISDKYFLCPLLQTMATRNQRNSAYHFHFVHQHETHTGYRKWFGVRHNSFIRFFFGSPIAKPEMQFSKEELNTVSFIIDKFKLFVHQGKLPDILFRDGYSEISLKIHRNERRHPREKFCQLLRSNMNSEAESITLFTERENAFNSVYYIIIVSIVCILTIILAKAFYRLYLKRQLWKRAY